MFFYRRYFLGRRRGAEAQECDCNAMVVGSIPTPGNEHSRKCGVECVNISFPLPSLMYAGYSMKPIFFFFEGFIFILIKKCLGSITEHTYMKMYKDKNINKLVFLKKISLKFYFILYVFF